MAISTALYSTGLIITGGYRDHKIRQFRMDSAELLQEFDAGSAIRAISLAHNQAFCGLENGLVHAITLAQVEPRPRRLASDPPHAMCLSGDGSRLLCITLTNASERRPATVTLYQPIQGKTITLPLPENFILLSPPPCALSEDGSMAGIVIGVRFLAWDTRIASLVQEAQIEQWMTTLNFTDDGSLATTGTAQGDVLVWGVQRSWNMTLQYHQSAIIDSCLSCDGGIVVTLAADRKEIGVWQTIPDGKFLHALPLGDNGGASAQRIKLTRNGARVAVAHSNAEVIFWDVIKASPLHTIKCGRGGEPVTFALSNSGRVLLYAGLAENVIELYHAETGACLSKISATALITADMVEGAIDVDGNGGGAVVGLGGGLMEVTVLLAVADASGLNLRRQRLKLDDNAVLVAVPTPVDFNAKVGLSPLRLSGLKERGDIQVVGGSKRKEMASKLFSHNSNSNNNNSNASITMNIIDINNSNTKGSLKSGERRMTHPMAKTATATTGGGSSAVAAAAVLAAAARATTTDGVDPLASSSSTMVIGHSIHSRDKVQVQPLISLGASSVNNGMPILVIPAPLGKTSPEKRDSGDGAGAKNVTGGGSTVVCNLPSSLL